MHSKHPQERTVLPRDAGRCTRAGRARSRRGGGERARKLFLQMQTREPLGPPGSSWAAGETLIPREERGPLKRSLFRSADERSSEPPTWLATRTILHFFQLKIACLPISRNR